MNLTKFKSKFPTYREIRGDGNCFYRAFIFTYFDKKLKNLMNEIDIDIDLKVCTQKSIPKNLL